MLTHLKMIGVQPALQAIRYELRRRLKDARFAGTVARPVGPWSCLGTVNTFVQNETGVTIHTPSGSLRIDVVAKDSLRVRVRADNDFGEPFSYAVVGTPATDVAFSVLETEQAIILRTDVLNCEVIRDGARLVVTTLDGRAIVQDAEGPAWRGDAVRLSLQMTDEESGHGLGERAFDFDLRGRSYALWNTDPAGYARGDDPINLSIPMYVGLRDTAAFGVFWNNSARGKVHVGAEEAPGSLVFEADAGELDYYVFAGPTAADVLRGYTALTGRMPMPPLWALGYHQCRWSYMSAEEARAIAREFRERQIPCDAVYLDIDYMDGFRCFTWNADTFPDPAKLIQDLRESGFRTVIMIDPGIKVDPDYHVCRSGLEQDVFLKYPDGSRFVAPVWPGDCYFPDFTKPVVRSWWRELYHDLLDLGVDGVWNDMNEPAIFSSNPAFQDIPDYVIHDMDGHPAGHNEAHNVYGMQMVRATRESLEAYQPERRHLVITRAGFAGVQRYASSWTADNLSTWDHMLLSISMCLNLGLSGLSFTGPDIGGFAQDGDGELLTRWLQLGVLLPFFRVHSAKGTRQQEPWAFGAPFEAIARQSIELRYRLLPYIYTTFAVCAGEGTPIVRSLATLEPGFTDCVDQYCHGEALMIAPVVQKGATQRTVRFPSGTWFDYWTGEQFEGGTTRTVDAPLDTLPLYVRAGHVVPHWPVMQHTGEIAAPELELRVYVGNGVSRLYEDAGDGKEYLAGAYRWSSFTMEAEPAQLTLGWHSEGQFVPPNQSLMVRVVGYDTPPAAVEVDGTAVPFEHDGGQVIVRCNRFNTLIITSLANPE